MGPLAHRAGDSDRLNAEEAMTFADLSLLLRTSTAEDEIMRQIAERGFLDPISPSQAESLATMGGSPRLIIVVQDPQYVLSAKERGEFTARRARRDNAMRGQANADQKQRQAEFAERQRLQELQQQTMTNVAKKEQEQKQRENAKEAYELKRKSLEQQIDSLQRTITEYRRLGWKENTLKSYNDRLKSLQDELFHLKSP
jgi:hypothetical protein